MAKPGEKYGDMSEFSPYSNLKKEVAEKKDPKKGAIARRLAMKKEKEEAKK